MDSCRDKPRSRKSPSLSYYVKLVGTLKHNHLVFKMSHAEGSKKKKNHYTLLLNRFREIHIYIVSVSIRSFPFPHFFKSLQHNSPKRQRININHFIDGLKDSVYILKKTASATRRLKLLRSHCHSQGCTGAHVKVMS